MVGLGERDHAAGAFGNRDPASGGDLPRTPQVPARGVVVLTRTPERESFHRAYDVASRTVFG